MTKSDMQMVDFLVKQFNVTRKIALENVKAWRKAEKDINKKFKKFKPR